MDCDESITGKGMDFMSRWQQYYYTWSTRSLSGNKVGLGIVAASDKDRDSLRIAGTEGAKAQPCRTEEGMIVERMNYSQEAGCIIRTGAVPSKQGADQRNNKFVHVLSAPWEDFHYPENYLQSLSYHTEWNGQETLAPLQLADIKKGRREAVKIAEKYGLNHRMADFIYDVYHCMLTSEKPLVIVNDTMKPVEFAAFSRELMILIHYLLPVNFRKEADYVSYVSEMNQEAHFLFSDQLIGKYCFLTNGNNKKRNYSLLEKEFFRLLAAAFLNNDQEYDRLIERIDSILEGLLDKRNQLEKCILSVMASNAGGQKEKENYFTSMERLMYWARKDASLLKTLEQSIKELDFHSMNEEELYSYIKLMLTGAGGETKELAFTELDRMLVYYVQKEEKTFFDLICYIRDNHSGMYEELLAANDNETGFTGKVLFRPIENLNELERAVKHHRRFFYQEDYADYLVDKAYEIYCRTSDEEKQLQIESLGKKVHKDKFIAYKKTAVKQVVDHANTLKEYLSIIARMDLSRLENVIHAFLYRRAVSFLKSEKQLDAKTEDNILVFAAEISMKEEMEAELASYYEKNMNGPIRKLNWNDLISVYFDRKEKTGRNTSLLTGKDSTTISTKVRNRLYANRYLELCEADANGFTKMNTDEWICFVLRVTEGLDEKYKKTAKEMIQKTKQIILQSGNLSLLAEVNHILKNHGTAPIHCPETLWNSVSLEDETDFLHLYASVEDIALLRCEKSDIYRQVKALYETAEKYSGTREEKAAIAWRRQKTRKKGGDEMDENPFLKACYFALEDILSKSIWAVLLGFYGFLFVTIREEVRILYSYNPSVIFLIVLVGIYIGKSVMGRKRRETPGSHIYVMGIAVLLLNWGLALDTVKGICILFAVAFLLAIGAKIAHYIIYIRHEDVAEDED